MTEKRIIEQRGLWYEEFQPGADRRLGVLLDHLGSRPMAKVIIVLRCLRPGGRFRSIKVVGDRRP